MTNDRPARPSQLEYLNKVLPEEQKYLLTGITEDNALWLMKPYMDARYKAYLEEMARTPANHGEENLMRARGLWKEGLTRGDVYPFLARYRLSSV
jgi:hypothetical protein